MNETAMCFERVKHAFEAHTKRRDAANRSHRCPIVANAGGMGRCNSRQSVDRRVTSLARASLSVPEKPRFCQNAFDAMVLVLVARRAPRLEVTVL